MKSGPMKGYLYTLEVTIAITLMLITFISLFANPPKKPELEISVMKQSGFDALDSLNKEGLLREMVRNSSETELESRLSALLSKSMRLEAEICTLSCPGAISANETVIAIDYYTSAFNGEYVGKRVRLWLSRK